MRRALNIALLFTSLFGYLEWGKGQHAFLYEGEWAFFTNLSRDPEGLFNPFVIIPLVGQILLLISLFQKRPGRLLTFLGMGCLAVLMLFLFLIGILRADVKVFASTLPFFIAAAGAVWYNRQSKKHST